MQKKAIINENATDSGGGYQPSRTSPRKLQFQLFVYDTELIRSEWDDPISAVIFTHPADVTMERKLAIAGTLTGVFNFFEQLLEDEVGVYLDARSPIKLANYRMPQLQLV